MDNLWYIHTMEYYLVIKRNELSGQKNDQKKKKITTQTKHGGTLNAYCQVKEANLKRLCPI